MPVEQATAFDPSRIIAKDPIGSEGRIPLYEKHHNGRSFSEREPVYPRLG